MPFSGIVGDVGGIFYLLIGSLSILCVLHAVWFYKIVLLALRVMNGESNVKDNRSETEDDPDELVDDDDDVDDNDDNVMKM